MRKYPGATFEGKEPLTDKDAAELIVFEAEQILSDRYLRSIVEHRRRRFAAAIGPVALECSMALGFAMSGMFFPISHIRTRKDNDFQ
jgi:hypothetical protein